MPRLCPRQGRAPGAMLGRRASRLAPPFTHAITHDHGTMRRDGDIAPYRHYTRQIHTRITPPALPRHCPWRLATAPYRHYTRQIRTRITPPSPPRPVALAR